MASEEHLANIFTGPKVWNDWRKKQSVDFCANLSFSDLTGVDLRDTDFRGANFRGANLSNTNFRSANLSRANLNGAVLRSANLSTAKLSGVDLSNADLSGANLRVANLIGADLSSTDLSATNFNNSNLSGVNISHAMVVQSVFGSTNLSDVTGLQSIRHRGPSIIDHNTMGKSRPPLPKIFLQGCGLLNWQIEAARLLQTKLTQDDIIDISYEVIRLRGEQPIRLFSSFISYSSLDEQFASRLHQELQNQGVRTWFSPEDLKIGDRIRSRIDEVIHLHDKLLLVLSEHSVRSDWVEKEVETALEKERDTGETVLFPIKLDDAVDKTKTGWVADIRRTRHIGDFSEWQISDSYKAAFTRVLRDLRA